MSVCVPRLTKTVFLSLENILHGAEGQTAQRGADKAGLFSSVVRPEEEEEEERRGEKWEQGSDRHGRKTGRKREGDAWGKEGLGDARQDGKGEEKMRERGG